MVKYGVISLFDNEECLNYVSNCKELFNTLAEAQEKMKELMQEEIEYFNDENGNNYTIDGEFIKNEYGTPIEKFMILEFYI